MARILVVDDDGHIRQVVRYALERAGHAVREAGDGAVALRMVAEETPDLIVLDVLLPEEDGLEVCRQVRRKSRLPIVFLSSRDEELDRVLGLELGGDDYVTKPFSPRELVARVAAVLRRTTPDGPAIDPPPPPLVRGRLTIDRARAECTIDNHHLVPLTVTEQRLLAAL